MEIVLHNELKSKKIDLEKSILSIQTSDPSIINNLIQDYDVAVIDNTDLFFAGTDVLNEITTFTKYPEISLISNIMGIIDMKIDFFDRDISSLSITEKILLNIFRNISSCKSIILFKDIYLGLDNNISKKLKEIIYYLRNNNYQVIICSSDVDIIYELADHSVIATKELIKLGKTDDIYTDVSVLLKNKLEVPTLPYITYKAKEEKNVKLFYSKDVRDIIKDIYKHV